MDCPDIPSYVPEPGGLPVGEKCETETEPEPATPTSTPETLRPTTSTSEEYRRGGDPRSTPTATVVETDLSLRPTTAQGTTRWGA